MRKINKIFRFPFAIIFSVIFAIIAYVATIVSMIFVDWDREYSSLKTIHTDIGEFYKTVMGIK
jgi:hypothetical protein